MKESRGITPLRTILQNCLNHIENLETNRSISDNYDKEFQDLKQFSETLKGQKEFLCTEGEKEVNRKKNRYKDILPFNVSRVILSEYAGISGSDYINANFIKGASGSPAYIASQGPLPNTVNDFWRMVVECEVQVIVMACNAQESGKHKCENYWVEKEGEEKRFGMVQICLVKASTVCPDFLVRTMRLKYTNDKDVTEERTVCQFHYSAWPDHGVPPLVRPLLDMVRLVRDTQASETLPVLVHCSAGCGRTGTICAIDFVWGLLRAGKLTEEFSLFNLVRDMRKQRVAMVQTKEQYILVHQAVRELFKEQLRVIESHPYENIDFNGVPLIKDFDEPFYDTICIKKDENCDEKQDKSEMKEKGEEGDGRLAKVDAAPPLPRKKRPNVLFSKQEKEAENLTEKNRSSFAEKEREKEKAEASLSGLLGKPRIVKLRALFEKSPTTKERTALKDRGSQTVSRSHSLGAIRKPLTAEVFEIERTKPSSAPPPQPTAESAKLKHSKSFSKSVPLIKRSKSLKTFNQSPHLCVSPPDHKVVKNYSSKASESETHGKESSRKVSSPVCDIAQVSGLVKECSKRRRSLESLMGDVPPSITWPTVVMTVGKTIGEPKTRQNRSPKQNPSANYPNKAATDLLKLQLQRLTLETDKKNFASGIGIRERRNSFRQAVSKNDFHNIFREYREKGSAGKKQSGNEALWESSKAVKNLPDGLSDQLDGVIFLEREFPSDVKLTRTKSVFDSRKYKNRDKVLGEPPKKITDKHSSQQISSNLVELRAPKAVLATKAMRTCEDPEKNSDPKNLFLKKLNSEILSERERECEAKSRQNYASSSSSGSVHSESKKPLLRTRSNVKPGGSYSFKSDNFDEIDGPNAIRRTDSGRFDGHDEMENTEKGFQHWKRDHQTYMKPQKASKPFDSYKYYTAPPASAYARINLPHKNPNYQVGEGSSGMRREEMEVRPPKEPFFSVSQKKNVCCGPPPKGHGSHENEFGSYRRNHNCNSDLYVALGPEFENSEKKLVLPPKMSSAEKNGGKNYDRLPWPHPSRSSTETASLDSSSEFFRFLGHHDSENPNKDLKMAKKGEQGKSGNKSRMNESSKLATQNSEQSMNLNKQKRTEDLKPNSSIDFQSYGVVGVSKLRPNPPKYSKDDFLLEEPTAPPRVKRHASVQVPRNIINGSDHVSPWTSVESKLSTGRSANLQVEKNAWSESLGVDLDAVAASMQLEKKEASVLKDAVWSSKNHLTTPTNSSVVKKKQHYL